jgi:hypothetical protein
MSRRTLLAAALVVIAAGLVALVAWFRANGPAMAGDSTAGGTVENVAPADEPITPTSEALIAESLAAGHLTYEESLRARAYALFDDPRLEPAFRSPIVDWEAMGQLLDEIAEKEATLSRELLDDLLPFRVRPNDPRSIVNRPRDAVVRTQGGTPPAWVGLAVPGAQLMVWIQGTEQELERSVAIAGRIWRAYPPYFTYPLNTMHQVCPARPEPSTRTRSIPTTRWTST